MKKEHLSVHKTTRALSCLPLMVLTAAIGSQSTVQLYGTYKLDVRDIDTSGMIAVADIPGSAKGPGDAIKTLAQAGDPPAPWLPWQTKQLKTTQA